MDSSQKRIDRGEQLRLLRDYQPIPYEFCKGKHVSALAMKAVLKAIDCRAGDGGTCFASQVTIAKDAGLKCTKTVARACQGLVMYGAIVPLGRRCRGDSRPVHHFQVNYYAIKVLAINAADSNRTPVPFAIARNENATGHQFTSNGTPVPKQPDTGSRATGHSSPLPAHEAFNTRPSPATDPIEGVWLELLDELNSMGMHAAPTAIRASRDRKASPAYVRFLIEEATRTGAGIPKLCKWIQGTTEHAMTFERFEEREQAKAHAEAIAIIDRVQATGVERKEEQLVIDSATFKALSKEGLERFASDAQRKAIARWEASQASALKPLPVSSKSIETQQTLNVQPQVIRAEFKRA